jgi:alpha-L-rhamnosidase
MMDRVFKPLTLALMLSAALIQIASASPAITAVDLQCEHRHSPLGIDVSAPRLSWKLISDQRGERQTAYQILVGSTAVALDANRADLWDTGKIPSDQSIEIPYAGKPRASQQQAFWKIRVWDSSGQTTPWSKVATWTTGILRLQDWSAKWITTTPTKALPIFRRSFTIAKPFSRAIISICGLGQFELHINGNNASDDILQPGWTNYRKTCLYATYDVTSQLVQGRNVLGVMLGNGMYNIPPQTDRYAKFRGSFGPPKLIAQLRIDYVDGSSDLIITDQTWTTSGGPITFSSIYGGEDYDARLEQPAWDKAAFNDSTWTPAEETSDPGGDLFGTSRSAPPIRVAEILQAKQITQRRPGTFIYDLGQNCSMIPQLTVRGPAGASVRLTPGELLHSDGTVSQASSGGPAYFTYTLKGRADESWSPRFCYYGSRYLQVDGAAPLDQPNPSGLPVVVNLQGRFITSTSTPAGEFSCSNELFNHTANIIRWAMSSNMQSLLTDCPHREKLGWLEQDHLVGPSLVYNFDVANLLNKICCDMADAQTPDGLVPDTSPEYMVFPDGFRDSPEWGSACILIPWQLYQSYGQTEPLRDHYDTMKRYVEYLGTKARNHMVSHGLGDWFDIGRHAPGKAQLTPISLTATAFYGRDISILALVARLLDRPDDASRYESLADNVRNAFNKTLYDPRTNNYATGSQCANALPLVFEIAPPEDRPAIIANLVADVRKHNNGLTAGDIGFRYLLRALADGGRSDVIYDMTSRSDRPGYGFILSKGATSLTEAWDARKSASQNHFMLGHIMEWFYSDLAGIQSDGVAFKRIIIKPTPVGDVTWASARYDSVYGQITSDWKRASDRFTLDVTIPPGTSATVYLPTDDTKSITESGQPADKSSGVTFDRSTGGRAVFDIVSGRFHFESILSKLAH